ncbi:MAG: hypothetical protein IH840_00155 [Candidatus Heimdallarchaeota archaeon]|nr:hypothetical protein [Candidatus Heimdallarchaeota archaeon]
MSVMCLICDGSHHETDHKSLGQQQVESAYDNSLLPEDEQTPIHFQGYHPNTDYLCQTNSASKTITHLGLRSYQFVVNCKPCLDVANQELEVYREGCYCSKCSSKRKGVTV